MKVLFSLEPPPIARALAIAVLVAFAWGHSARCHAATATDARSAEAPFLAENRTAMDRMMAGMDVDPTGDVDRDFVAMMVPHHQGAIDMAEAMLRYGKNQTLRRLAQEIIVTQQQEIAAMRLAVGEKLPPSEAAPTQVPSAGSEIHRGTTMPVPQEPGR